MLLLVGAWAAQAILAAAQVRKFLRRLNYVAHSHRKPFQPPAVVIVPFKGVDIDLPDNVHSLCEQDYPDYELLLVVESSDDPAYLLLVEQQAKYPHRRIRVLVAGVAPPDEGQKVHNLRYALERIHVPAEGDQVWVFLDSDTVPDPTWLAQLIQPLATRKTTAVTTGYRWLVPPAAFGDFRTAGGWPHVASVINSSIACMGGMRDELNHAWGGSMAVLAATAQRGNLIALLRGALSDDFQMTNMARQLGLRVYFVHRLLAPSTVTMTRAELFEFARRQYIITRVHAPYIFFWTLTLLSLYVVGTIAAWGWLILFPHDALPPAAAILTVFIANQFRAMYRRRVITSAFSRDIQHRLGAAMKLDRWATTFWMAVHWCFVVSALFGRTFRWRGNRYRLRGPQQVEKIE